MEVASRFPGPLSFPEIEQRHPDIFAHLFQNSRLYSPYQGTANISLRTKEPQCHGTEKNCHNTQEKSMSQGPAAKPSTSTSPPEAKHKRLPPLGSRALPPIQSANASARAHDVSTNTAVLQHPSDQQSQESSSTADYRSSRPIGVKNLLNPASNGDSTNSQSRCRNGGYPDSPPGVSRFNAFPRAATPSLPAPSMTSRSPANVSLPSITPPSICAYPQSLGRSPSTHLPSPVIINQPNGTIDAKQSPFVLAKDHAMNGGPFSLGLPELNRVTSMPGETIHGPVGQPTASLGRRGSSQDSSRYDHVPKLVGGAGANGSHASASQSDSPSTQYSSYSIVSRPTPPAQPNASAGQPQSFFTPFNSGGAPSSMAQMTYGGPASSGTGGGSTYQMTFDTEIGPIQVPVDVQKASRVADEKRKRNATASSRFRQRRKEKERETSQNIAKLEAQVREIEEEKEFYRGERDYFRSLASHVPGNTHRLPRPVSPRQRRHASMNGAIGFGNVQFQGPENGNRNGGRNTRRRTNSHMPVAGQVDVAPRMSHHSYIPTSNLANGGGHPQEHLSLQSGHFQPPMQR